METIKPSTPSETAAIKLGQKLTISDSLLITPQGSTLATSNVWKKLRDTDQKVSKFTKVDESGLHWAKAIGVVHSSPENVLAFLWDYCGNLRVNEHLKTDGNLLR